MNSPHDGEGRTPPFQIERRHSMCPSCKGVRGEAFNISASPGRKTVSYRCPACNRTWDHTEMEQGA